MADRSLTAVLIDDHEIVAAGLEAWCRLSDPPIEIVASGRDVEVAFTGRGRDADVVILDLQLRDEGGLSFPELRRLVAAGRRVVVYTQRVEPDLSLRCIEFGAMAYVSKGEVRDHLMTAVRDAATGNRYTTPTLGAAILSDHHHSPALSDNERIALTAWCGAKSMKLVAESMGVAESTVKTYINRARQKYEDVGRSAKTKGALIRRALEDGLIERDDLEGENYRW